MEENKQLNLGAHYLASLLLFLYIKATPWNLVDNYTFEYEVNMFYI